jgi:hypothetical protein
MPKKPKNRLEFDSSPKYEEELTVAQPSNATEKPLDIGENVFPALPAHLSELLGRASVAEETPSQTGMTSKVTPSALLAKLSAFLPEMRRANEELDQVCHRIPSQSS